MTKSTKQRKPKARPSEMLEIALEKKKAFDAKQAKKAAKQLQEQVKAQIKADSTPAPVKKVKVSGKTGRKVTVTTKHKKKGKKRSAYKQAIYDAIQLDKQENKKKYAEEVKQLNAENKAYADKCEADRNEYIKNNPQNFSTTGQGKRYFDTKPKCYTALEEALKVNGVLPCAYCKHTIVWRNHTRQNFKCAKCLRQFTVTTGTFLHKSKIDIRLVFEIIMREMRSTTGLTIAEVLDISDDTISYPTAVKLLHNIRTCAFTQKLFKIEENSRASADTTSISGRDVNRHDKDKKGLKKLYKEAEHFLTIKQERGDAIVERVLNLATAAMRWGLKKVPLSTELTTDGHRSFNYLKKAGYIHHTVNHSMGENARGRISSNGAESVHAMIKVALGAHFNTIKKSNLQAFINSLVFTKNTKHKLTFEQQFKLALQGIATTTKPVNAKVYTIAANKTTAIPQHKKQQLTKVA